MMICHTAALGLPRPVPTDAVCFVYTCWRLIDLSLLCIHMPVIDRPLSGCRYSVFLRGGPDSVRRHHSISGAFYARSMLFLCCFCAVFVLFCAVFVLFCTMFIQFCAKNHGFGYQNAGGFVLYRWAYGGFTGWDIR